MCDFSPEHLASRPAKVGDQLVTTKFGGMYTNRLLRGRRAKSGRMHQIWNRTRVRAGD